MRRYFSVLWLWLSFFTVGIGQNTDPYVLMVSFDGFRHDYVERYNAPTFKQFIAEGSSTKGLICSFPSKTFPNHYTLVTGLYPGNHGLVDNGFYDGTRNDTFSMRKRYMVEDAYYYGGLPLWQLVQEHGMKSASYFWVGSEAPVAGRYPDYYYVYDGSVPNEDRIAQVMEWFQLPLAERPNFVTLYFSLVDSRGHRYGPEHPETGKAVLEADSLLAQIMTGLDSIDLPVNVILTSDHGMAPVRRTPEYVLELPKLLGAFQDSVRIVSSGTNTHIYCPQALQERLFYHLKPQEKHFSVYRKGETPEHWHYRRHTRIGDLLLTAEAPYVFTTRIFEAGSGPAPTIGVHGYDPYTNSDMNGIFYAKGPQVRSGIRLKAFENVHIYPFVARLLGINAESPDSDPEVLQSLLQK